MIAREVSTQVCEFSYSAEKVFVGSWEVTNEDMPHAIATDCKTVMLKGSSLSCGSTSSPGQQNQVMRFSPFSTLMSFHFALGVAHDGRDSLTSVSRGPLSSGWVTARRSEPPYSMQDGKKADSKERLTYISCKPPLKLAMTCLKTKGEACTETLSQCYSTKVLLVLDRPMGLQFALVETTELQ